MKDRENELTESEEAYLEHIEEDDDERRGMPFFLLFLFTTIAVLFALGLSFSTINLLQNNETINSLISKNQDKYIITYSENINGNESNINLINQFPIPDYQGKQFNGQNEVYNFSLLVSENSAGLYYEFTAIPTITGADALDEKDVKIYLTKNKEDVDFSYKNGKVKVYTDYEPSKNGSEGVVIYSGKITEEDAERGRIDFIMRMWVADETEVNDDFSNKKFGVKVNTYVAEEEG